MEESLLEIKKNEKQSLVWGAGCSVLVGVIVLVVFTYNVITSYSLPQNGQPDLPSFGTYGDFVGGLIGTLFSVAGVFLLFLTLKEQRENFEKERLETNLFEMIKFHKENIAELEFTYHEGTDTDSKVKAVKRKVFKVIYSHYHSLWNELDFLFINEKFENIYTDKALIAITDNQNVTKRNIDIKELAKIDIIYLIIFFGLSRSDRDTIMSLTAEMYKETFIRSILDYAKLKPKRNSRHWSKWETLNEIDDPKLKVKVFKAFFAIRTDSYVMDLTTFIYFDEQLGSIYYGDDYEKFYGGHQFRLGHYYRHLFQTLTYIDKQEMLNYDEKYFYVKILRAQLSNYEQILFFLNSLSSVGREIELMQTDINRQLLTKYNFITNIPTKTICENIDLTNYYPSVDYEIIRSNVNWNSFKKFYK